jgi:hypothetical protein
MRNSRHICSGWGSSRIRHGSPGPVPVARASRTHAGPLLEGHRDAQVASYLHLLPGRAGHDELAGRQRADGLGECLVRRPGLQEVHHRIHRRELSDRIRAEQHRPGADQGAASP